MKYLCGGSFPSSLGASISLGPSVVLACLGSGDGCSVMAFLSFPLSQDFMLPVICKSSHHAFLVATGRFIFAMTDSVTFSTLARRAEGAQRLCSRSKARNLRMNPVTVISDSVPSTAPQWVHRKACLFPQFVPDSTSPVSSNRLFLGSQVERRHALDDLAAIPSFQQALVVADNRAAVFFGPDQPAGPLIHSNAGGRH